MDLDALATKMTEKLTPALGPMIDAALEAKVAPLREKQSDLVTRLFAGEGARTEAPREKGLNAARMVLAFATAKSLGMPSAAVDYARKAWGADDPVTKALSSADFTAGGSLIPPNFSSELIELLDAAVIVTSLGPVIYRLDLPLTIPKTTGGTTAAYTAENANLLVSEMTTGELTLTPRELGGIVPISNKLLKATNGNADVIVRADLVKRVALRTDLAFIRGDGLQDTPKGLRTLANASNIFAATQAGATATLTEVTADLSKAYLKLANANVPMTKPGWIMAPRSLEFLRTIRDGNGNLVYDAEISRGTLRGFPFRITTQVPINLGGGTNESEVYFADFGEVKVLESSSIMIDTATEASYTDSAGVTHSLFQKNQTAIRVITSNDIGLAHDLAVAVMTTVKWGA